LKAAILCACLFALALGASGEAHGDHSGDDKMMMEGAMNDTMMGNMTMNGTMGNMTEMANDTIAEGEMPVESSDDGRRSLQQFEGFENAVNGAVEGIQNAANEIAKRTEDFAKGLEGRMNGTAAEFVNRTEEFVGKANETIRDGVARVSDFVNNVTDAFNNGSAANATGLEMANDTIPAKPCCKALNAECMACASDLSVEEYCAQDGVETVGCEDVVGPAEKENRRVLRRLLQDDPDLQDLVGGLLPQEVKIPPPVDLTDLAELEAEAPAFENEPFPTTGVDFAAGPGGDDGSDGGDDADYSESPDAEAAPALEEGDMVMMDPNATMNGTEMANMTMNATDEMANDTIAVEEMPVESSDDGRRRLQQVEDPGVQEETGEGVTSGDLEAEEAGDLVPAGELDEPELPEEGGDFADPPEEEEDEEDDEDEDEDEDEEEEEEVEDDDDDDDDDEEEALAPGVVPEDAPTVVNIGSEPAGELIYDPEEVTIEVGDTVTWTNVDGIPHDVVFETVPEGVDPQALSHPELFSTIGQNVSTTFTTPGTYTYYCTPHKYAGMVGTITVE